MGDDVVVLAVLVATAGLLVFLVLAPWRSPRRDALGDEEYYAILAGEEPPDSPPKRPEGPDDEGPSAGDVRVP